MLCLLTVLFLSVLNQIPPLYPLPRLLRQFLQTLKAIPLSPKHQIDQDLQILDNDRDQAEQAEKSEGQPEPAAQTVNPVDITIAAASIAATVFFILMIVPSYISIDRLLKSVVHRLHEPAVTVSGTVHPPRRSSDDRSLTISYSITIITISFISVRNNSL